MSKTEPNIIKVLLVRLKKEPEVVEVEASIEGFRKLLSGSTDSPQLEWIDIGDGVVVICDEDGKPRKLSPNRWLLRSGRTEDFLVGDFFICGVADSKEISLSDEDVYRWTKKFTLSQSEVST